MLNLELTENECYFLLLRLREVDKRFNNRYSNSIHRKLENLFAQVINRIAKHNEEQFKMEYLCDWVGDK